MIKSGIKVPLRYIPQEKPDQIAPFYIMETKVWNDLYAKFADAQPDVAKSSKWKEGWAASTTQYPGGKLSGDWPVVNISCAEAHAFANWLGGRLPSTSEWDRAAGWYKGGRGPIQGPTDAIPTSEEVAYNRLERGPLPVGKATRDVSPWGCRDMAANGLEWTRNIRFGAAESEVLDETPPKDTRMLVRGRSFGEVKPPIFADYEAYLREERTKGAGENFFGSRYDLSFRVVIETLP